MAKRLRQWGQRTTRPTGTKRRRVPGSACSAEDALDIPMKWRKPSRFVNSMSDLFHPPCTTPSLPRHGQRWHSHSSHLHRVLTKRPKRMATLLNDRGVYRDDVNEWADGLYVNGDVYGDVTGFSSGFRNWLPTHLAYADLLLPNVWLGTSIENDRYTFRADHLRATPAAASGSCRSSRYSDRSRHTRPHRHRLGDRRRRVRTRRATDAPRLGPRHPRPLRQRRHPVPLQAARRVDVDSRRRVLRPNFWLHPDGRFVATTTRSCRRVSGRAVREPR